jgi:hypothetical protein
MMLLVMSKAVKNQGMLRRDIWEQINQDFRSGCKQLLHFKTFLFTIILLLDRGELEKNEQGHFRASTQTVEKFSERFSKLRQFFPDKELRQDFYSKKNKGYQLSGERIGAIIEAKKMLNQQKLPQIGSNKDSFFEKQDPFQQIKEELHQELLQLQKQLEKKTNRKNKNKKTAKQQRPEEETSTVNFLGIQSQSEQEEQSIQDSNSPDSLEDQLVERGQAYS